MKRKAVLIEASRARGQEAIDGPVYDVARMKNWLMSNVGGAWESDEIIELHNPTIASVNAAIASAGTADFGFVTFSGHGGILEDKYGGKTQKVVVGTGEAMNFNDLKPKSARNILICDSCRIVERITQMSQATKTAAVIEARATQFQRWEYRRAYDNVIGDANPGNFVMFGCAVNQYSYEDPDNGGLFTISLIEQSARWSERQSESLVLYVSAAFDFAKAQVLGLKPAQSPRGGPENRSGNAFPFAVSLN